MPMNCHPEYPEDPALLKSIHDVGSYGGGGEGCYSLDGQIVKQISSIQKRRPSKSKDREAKAEGRKGQEKPKERSLSSSIFHHQMNSPDIEKGPMVVQVHNKWTNHESDSYYESLVCLI